jgi:hypothetical protein
MLTLEACATTTATPEQVWAQWTDVAQWTQGDVIEEAALDGAFAVGSTIRTKAKGFPRSTLTITVVDRPHLWVDESRAPGLRMTFEHVIEPGATGTKVTERALISGALAPVVGRLMRARLERLLAASTADLASRAALAAESG